MKINYYVSTFAFWLLTTVVVYAQSSIYFFYDPACMQKFEYEQVNKLDDIAYDEYYISISDETKAIFRVPKKHKSIVKEIPVKPFMCNDRTKIVPALIKEINASRKAAYIVAEAGEEYALYEIQSVATLTEKQSGIVYEDATYGFKYDYTMSKSGEILNKRNHKERNVYFESKQKNSCLPAYQFKIVSRHIETPIKYLNLIATLGIQKIYTTQGALNLKAINGTPLNNFIAQRCHTQLVDATPPNGPTASVVAPDKPAIIDTIGMSDLDKKLWLSKRFKGFTARSLDPIAKPANSTSQNGTPAATLMVESTKELLPGGIYLVKEKENLYGISEKFGISIQRLIEINNLEGYQLGLNQALKVVDDGSAPKQNKNPLTRIDEVNKTKTTIHVVVQGETLYSISKLYGLELKDIYNLNKELTDHQIDINQQLVVGIQSIK